MGRYIEEFSVGDTFVTPVRTIVQQDIHAFADLTEDHNPVHVDPEFAARSIFGGCISHGPMMVGMAFGLLSKLDLLDGTIIALKGLEWSFSAPIRPGDTVHVRAHVVETRLSRKFPDRGSVQFQLDVVNQADAIVQIGLATGIVKAANTQPQ
jgi:acyl dehydratase